MKLAQSLSALALASIAGTAAFPQAGPSATMIQRFHKVVSDTIFIGAPPKDVALVLANPGIPVAAPPDFSKAESIEDGNVARWNFSTQFFSILDTPMLANGIYSQKQGEKCSNIVRDFLEYAQLAPAVKDEVRRKLYESAKKKLTREQLNVFEKRYNRYQEILAKKTAATKRGDEKNADLLAIQLRAAERDLLVFGERRKILEMLQQIREYENLQPAVWQENLRTLFAASKVTDGKPFPLQITPPPENWNDDEGWTRIEFTNSQKAKSSSSSSSSTTASGAGAIGGFTFGGGFEKQDEMLAQASNDKDFTLSFEVKRVLLDRPWLEASMFGNKGWTWPAEHKKVSYGSIKANAANEQDSSTDKADTLPRMPLIITEVILCRNVMMNSSTIRAALEKKSSSFKANAQGGWGPFSFNVSHQRKSASESENEDTANEGLSTTGTQIMAFIGQAMPETPVKFSDAK